MPSRQRNHAMPELPPVDHRRHAFAERRVRPWNEPWLDAVLDELDYGLLLLGADARVLRANHAARAELEGEHPLCVAAGRIGARDAAAAPMLADAIAAAAHRGLRRLLVLGEGAGRVNVSVVPLPAPAAERRRAVLLVLGKRRVCESLSVQWFARSHGLTLAETQVLEALCGGDGPAEIASRHGVALSTVRTQIGSVRAKTGAASIRALVRQVAVLPPLVGALRA
jgi:DNA-binding CsgD family transcriptional regulator